MADKQIRGHFFHVARNKTDNLWHVKEVKGSEFGTFDNKEEAVKKAEELAKNTEMGHVVVHDERGHFKTFEHF